MMSTRLFFVDDSDDNTSVEIEKQMALHSNIRLIHREKNDRNGLAMAFVYGFKEACGEYILCMDSDLQHPPEVISTMFERILSSQNVDLVVASRYKTGGSAEGLDGIFRRLVSRMSCFVSWVILPPTRKSSDPMTGFFLVKKSVVQSLNFTHVRGFKILVDILVRSDSDLKVLEIPFTFRKRKNNESKATLKQGFNFIIQLIDLRNNFYRSDIKYHAIAYVQGVVDHARRLTKLYVFSALVLWLFWLLIGYTDGLTEKVIISVVSLLTLQGMLSLFLMLYAWEIPDRISLNSAPETFEDPFYSFTILLPARHEELVIEDTIRSAAAIDYPEDKKEILVLINDHDDSETIRIAKETIDAIGVSNIHLVTFSGLPINKPKGLNVGLKKATKNIVTIFDAEDEVHPDIFRVINTVFLQRKIDVIQSGVQLMNYRSSWFALFNVLEYFFWFKSSLHFFAEGGMIPLGGNTVFFKRKWLKRVGGWDEHCLTEDADIGLRLSLMGAKTSVVYDEKYVTREETPATVYDFLKQRTRWNQGFIQILFKGDWLKLPRTRQKFIAFYVFSWPIFQGILFVLMPISFFIAETVKMTPLLSVFSNVPTYLLIIFLIIFNLGLHDFIKNYSFRYSPILILKTVIFFLPFVALLGLASFRSVYRQIIGNNTWEKTAHFNLQRKKETFVNEA
jgi:cellulose synthase/poly-beta-1,6-N-acetylglucosamine synthase-like glycosyltransferase